MHPQPMRALARPGLVLAFGLVLLTGMGEPAAQLYRWVDEQGNVQFSDRLPPAAADKARTELSRDGLPVRDVEAAKTAEEIRREQELERLRREQAEILERQREADRRLLATYRSVDDLFLMRDGNIASIDVVIQSTKANIRRQQNRLNRLQSDAADLERVGRPIHPALERDIVATKQSIGDDLASILRHERSKQDVYEKFSSDLERFRRLKDIENLPADVGEDIRPTDLENLVACANRRECDQLWSLAIGYVEAHATLPIESSSDNVVLTMPPATDEDISLIVSRIRDEDGPGAMIFLDLQCRSYTASVASCRTPGRVAVLEGFRAALTRGGG